MQSPDMHQISQIIDQALAEDCGRGDITSQALIPEGLYGQAYMLVKENGIIAGTPVVEQTFYTVDRSLQVEVLIPDGTPVRSGDITMRVSGKVLSLLKAERVALNFFQRLSGIASTTARYVSAVEGLGVDVADTRKTTPGLRILEKYAVKTGGGRNHRFDLGEAVLIKDNHFSALRSLGMSYSEIVLQAKASDSADVKIEAEASTIDEAVAACEAGVDIVMLDNMNLNDMRRAVELIKGKAEIEASGNITLDNVREVALTGVDFISVGALTHSYKSLDISLEFEPSAFKLI